MPKISFKPLAIFTHPQTSHHVVFIVGLLVSSHSNMSHPATSRSLTPCQLTCTSATLAATLKQTRPYWYQTLDSFSPNYYADCAFYDLFSPQMPLCQPEAHLPERLSAQVCIYSWAPKGIAARCDTCYSALNPLCQFDTTSTIFTRINRMCMCVRVGDGFIRGHEMEPLRMCECIIQFVTAFYTGTPEKMGSTKRRRKTGVEKWGFLFMAV